jgi:uncharacterized membrane protein YfcA
MMAEVVVVLLLAAAVAGLLAAITWIWGGPLLQMAVMR